MRLNQIAKLLELSPRTYDTEFNEICIDSRKVKPGDLFIAIRGNNFDGHDFVNEAATRGARAILCEKDVDCDLLQLKVNSSVTALAKIASFHRNQHSCSIIALTGSNGKTTVKEMIASILPKPSLATLGNLNNHLGVPLSLLQLKKEHKYAVFELGANHVGEIAYTVEMVKPEVCLINNIAPAHIEGFGSIDKVAEAKAEIYKGLSRNGTAIVNADDHYANFWDKYLKDKKKLTFSQLKEANLYSTNISFDELRRPKFTIHTPKGDIFIELQVPGLHNVSNALAAATATYALNLDLNTIRDGLNAFQGVVGRLNFKDGLNGSIIIDDTYNANPGSVLKALEVLGSFEEKKIFVLGDMGELGDDATKYHSEIGHAAKDLKIDVLYTVGQLSMKAALSFGENGYHFNSQAELADKLIAELNNKAMVLVKGSRSAKMENIVNILTFKN